MKTRHEKMIRAIEIGQECNNIAEAISQLVIAYGNFEGQKSAAYHQPLFKELTERREALRHELVQINYQLTGQWGDE